MNRKSLVWLAVAAAAATTVLLMPAARGAHEVVLRDGQFHPREEYVGQGDTVIWIHDDGGRAHSVTADDGSFDSHPNCSSSTTEQCLEAGETFSRKFDKLGRYRYYSKPHGGPGGQGASGVIVVVEKGTGPSSSTSR